jgi:hypothetical protein
MTLRASQWVEVKGAGEIASTLDADGALDGLPFMPEMVAHCGQRYRVLRYAEKTCIDIGGGQYISRPFHRKDVVLLDGLRCSGESHDGCQRLCMFFWKTAWLRNVSNGQARVVEDQSAPAMLSAKLKTQSGPGRYFCQSTQLAAATRPTMLKRSQTLSQAFTDLRSGAVGLVQMLELVVVPLGRKIRDRLLGRPRLLGTQTTTPVGKLNLQPGEIVQIRPIKEMQETLDSRGRNRGLICDIELERFCGQRYRVLSRLDRMISESTGEMRKVEGTVILDGNLCLCARVVGGCPRLEYCYWREVWLNRVDS